MKALSWFLRLYFGLIFILAMVVASLFTFPGFAWKAVLKFFDSTAGSRN